MTHPSPCAPTGVSKALRRARARCATCRSAAAPRRADRDHRPQRRRQDDAAADPRRRAEAERRRGRRSSAGEVGWVPQQPALYSKLSVAREPAPVRAAGEGRRRRRPPSSGCSSRPGCATAPATRSARSPAATASGSTSPIGLLARARRCCCSTSRPSSLDPRQRERLWAFVDRPRRGRHAVVYATHNVAEAERYADRVLVLADGELLFSGTPARARARRVGEPTRPTSRARSSGSSTSAGH